MIMNKRKKYYTLFVVFVCFCFLVGCGCFDSKKESLDNHRSDTASDLSTEPFNDLMLGDDNINYIPSVDTDSAMQIENSRSDDNSLDDSYATKLEGKITIIALADSEGNLDITVINDSDGIIEMSKDFSIMKEESGTWLDVPLNMVFSDELISVEAGERYVFNYNIGTLTTLESGKSYQVEKEVFAGEKKYSVSTFLEIQ